MADLVLTVYQSDDATPLFEVGTSKAHANPYLAWPESFSSSEVDLKNGGGVIGEVNLRIIDPQTGATQSVRWLTEKLGIAAGQAGEGHSAILGHRALLKWDDGRVVRDGALKRASLNESFAGFTFQLRDIRERGRKVDLFHTAAMRDAGGVLTNAPSVYPRGRFGGYGKLPMYDLLPPSLQNLYGWMQPPVAPLTGWVDYVASDGTYILDIWGTSGQNAGEGADIHPKWVLTDQAWEVMGRREQIEHNGDQAKNVLTDVRVLWRDPDSVDQTWKEIEVAGWGINNIFEAANKKWVSYNDGGETVREKMLVPSMVRLGDGSTGSTMPPAGETIEFLVVYVGEPTDHYPFVYEGPLADFMQQLYDGDFSSTDPGLRYDAAEVAALPHKVRIREYKKKEDLRNAEEEIYRAIGYAPAVVDGLITPVSAHLRSGLGALPEITDQNAKAIPGWEHDTAEAITDVLYTYNRDRRVPIEKDPRAERSDGDGIASEEIKHKTPGPQWAKDLVGDKEHSVEGWMFRALGTETGASQTYVMDETGARIARDMGFRMIDRWLFGGQVSACRVRAADFAGLKPGSWVVDSRSWRPNYHTLQRGGPVVAQVMSLENIHDAWLDLVLVDAGPSLQPLATPVLGTLTVDAYRIVTAPLTGVPTDADTEVHYAIASAEPVESSHLWTFGGRRTGDGSVRLPPAPAGATLWVRGRAAKNGRFPSPWTVAKSIAIPITPEARLERVTIHDDGSATIQWQTDENTGGVRLHWKTTAADIEVPDPVGGSTLDLEDLNQQEPTHTLPAGTVDLGQRLTVGVEPWTGWTGSAVTGTAGEVVSGSAVREGLTQGVPVAELSIESQTGVEATVRYSGSDGSAEGQTEAVEYQRRIDTLIESGAAVEGAWSGWSALPDTEVIARLPYHDRAVVMRARDSDGVPSLVMRVQIGRMRDRRSPTRRLREALERSGMPGLPGEQTSGFPTISDDGIDILVNPSTRRVENSLAFPNGLGMATGEGYANRAGTGLDAGGAVQVDVPRVRAAAGLPAISGDQGRLVPTEPIQGGTLYPIDTGDAVSVLTNGATVEDGADRARTGLGTTGLVELNVPRDHAAGNLPAISGGQGRLVPTEPVEGGTLYPVDTGDAVAVLTDGATVTSEAAAGQNARTQIDTELPAGDTLEGGRRAQEKAWRGAGLGARHLVEAHRDREGQPGLPGVRHSAQELVSADGVSTLLDPSTRRVQSALLFPNGGAANTVEGYANRAGTGLEAGGAVAINVPRDHAAGNLPAISDGAGRLVPTEPVEGGTLYPVDTGDSVAILTNGAMVEDGATRARDAIQSGGTSLQDYVTQGDGAGQRVIAKGHQAGSGLLDYDQNNARGTVTFSPVFQGTPMVLLRGGITYNASITGDQALDLRPDQLSPSGFRLIAKNLKRDGVTNHTDYFASGAIAMASPIGTVINCNLDPAGASGGEYTVAYQFTADTGSDTTLSLTMAIDTNDGSGWVERATRRHLVGPGSVNWTENIQLTINVTGLGLNDDIRVRFKTDSSSYGIQPTTWSVDPSTVIYPLSTDTTEPATLDQAYEVSWEAMAVN